MVTFSHVVCYVVSLDHSPVCEAVLLPFEVVSKSGETSDLFIGNPTAGLLHHGQSVSIQRPGDLETKESLHLSQLLVQWADAPSDSWTLLLCEVEEFLQVVLEERNIQSFTLKYLSACLSSRNKTNNNMGWTITKLITKFVHPSLCQKIKKSQVHIPLQNFHLVQ